MNYLFFLFSFSIALAMIGEGCSILLWKKQITPMPSRILYWMGVLVVGAEKSRQQYLGRASANNLRVYAINASVLGLLVLGASFVYLFTAVV
jgi:hypothetical protein